MHEQGLKIILTISFVRLQVFLQSLEHLSKVTRRNDSVVKFDTKFITGPKGDSSLFQRKITLTQYSNVLFQ